MCGSLTAFQGNSRWVRLGCSFMTTLMSSPDGVRLLSSEDSFLEQIKKSFAQLDPVSPHHFKYNLCTLIKQQFNGVPDSDPIFSKRRVAETLTYGYLEMLGALSKFKDGIEWVCTIFGGLVVHDGFFLGYWKNTTCSLLFTISANSEVVRIW